MSTYVQFDPNDIFLKLESAAEEMAEADEIAMRLEELKSVLMAEIAVAYRDGGKSLGEAEMRAKADPRYRTHIEGMCIARRKANRARAKYADLKIWVEMKRTAESSARTMITRGP